MENNLTEFSLDISLTNRSNSFFADCNGLIDDFLKNPHLDFTKFTKEWQKKNFHLIFCGFAKAELPEITDELFSIAKGIMLSSSNEIDKRTAALFLLFGLYSIRNSESKIRLTLGEARELDSFLNDVGNKEYFNEVAFILSKLFLDNALIFYATSKEYCPTNYQQNTWDELDEQESAGLNQCHLLRSEDFSPTNGFDEVKIFDIKYEELKSLIPGLTSKSAVAPKKNFTNELISCMLELKAKIEPSKEKGSSSQPDKKRRKK